MKHHFYTIKLLVAGVLTFTSLNAKADIFISEYVEGTSNNKAIEIYNPTSAAVDLSQYDLQKDVNGANVFTSIVALTGTLQPGQTFTIANTSASATIKAVANLTTGNLNFNGNDQVRLIKIASAEVLDILGAASVTSADYAKDVTLRRKSHIVIGNTTYDTNEWDSYPTDTFAGLGSHTTSSNVAPTLNSVTNAPTFPSSSDAVTVTVDAQDSDGTIASVIINWGTLQTDLSNHITTTLNDSRLYEGSIAAQPHGTTIYYTVTATDNGGSTKESTIAPIRFYDAQTTTLPYTESFTTGFSGVQALSEKGSKTWYISSDNVPTANGYNSTEEEDWLILPSLNLDETNNEIMTFATRFQYGTENEANYLRLMYSTDYAGIGLPSLATWHTLEFTQPATAYTTAIPDFTASGDVDLSSIAGNHVTIAFKYYSTDAPRLWTISDINIAVASGGTTTVSQPTDAKAEVSINANELVISGSANGAFSLYSITGAAVLNGQLHNNQNRFAISALPKGIYLLQIPNSSTVIKLVKP